MTANVLQEDVQRYLDVGMNAYISKPFHTDDLLLKMHALLVDNKMESAKDKPAVETGVGNLQALPDRVTDMNFLHQFTGGNPEKQKKYVGMFLDNGPKLLTKIKDGGGRHHEFRNA